MKKKKNDHYSPRPLPANENSSNKVLPALQQQRSAQINLNTAHDPAGDALPPWRDKLEDADVMKMQGCEAIADDAAKLVIIRPKNGAKEGIITRLDPGKSVSNDDITSGNATQADKDYYDFFSARNAEAEAIEKFIAEHPGYTLQFEGRIYFYKALTRGKEPRDANVQSFLQGNKLASLGNIGDVNVRFMTSAYALLKNDTEIKDIKELSKWKFQTNHNADFARYFQGMKSLTGYTDFSNWQSGFNIVYMESMFQNAGTDDFVLNFSNLKLYYKGGSLYSKTNLQNTFAGLKGVLVANNWKVDFEYTKRNITRHVNALIASKNTKTANGRTKPIDKSSLNDPNLFGQTEAQTKEDYTLTNLVVTDNPDLLELGAKAKYYKEITITYKDKTETLQLPACYDSRVNENFETDTSKPASGDYMKVVKQQVDKAIQAKEQEMRQKYNIPADMQLFPTQAITFTPTSLFQNYKIDYPPADVQMEAQPLEQTVYEGQEINQIKITVTSQKEENLPTFAFDQAWQTELAKIGLKFTPAAPDPNNRKVLAAGTISGIIKDNSLQQELDSKGVKTYQITVKGKTTSGKEINCEQILKITVTRQIATGNKPETSGKLSLYLVAAGLLSLLLFSGRKVLRN